MFLIIVFEQKAAVGIGITIIMGDDSRNDLTNCIRRVSTMP